MEKRSRYVYRELSDNDMEAITVAISGIHERLSDNSIKFEAQKLIHRRGIDILFGIMTTTEEYVVEDGGKVDSLDVECMGDTSQFTSEKIDGVITERGYGMTTAEAHAIEAHAMHDFTVAHSVATVGRLKDSVSVGLESETLAFMKKTQFVSNIIQKVYTPAMKKKESGVVMFEHEAEGRLALDRDTQAITSCKGPAVDGCTVNGVNLGSIAQKFLDEAVARTNNDPRCRNVEPSSHPTVSMVFGLPGLGKSSIYVKSLRQEGACCFDLDELALDIADMYGIPLDGGPKGSKDNVYKIACAIHDSAVTKALVLGYDVAVEKIGYTKGKIAQDTGVIDTLIQDASTIAGHPIEYNIDLLMAAGSSVTSAESNSVRNSEQIFSGERVRAYDYDTLLYNNNCTTYAYIDCMADPNMRARYGRMAIANRQGSFTDLCLTHGQSTSVILRESDNMTM